jgi:CheY-like chemotaxis protein
MNGIVGFCTLLGEPDADAQSRKEYIDVIIQCSDHLLSIISDIVDISNIEANIVKISKNSININLVLKLICDQFLPKAGEKKLQLICDTQIEDSDALIITDSTKLTQILINLINNALKFTDDGFVKVGCVLTNKFLEFHVSDTGIGISEEHHLKIFNRFYQVKNETSRLYEGTGLGLAISKAYVDLMGGKIWVSSEPEKGTTFTFTIPYEKQIIAEKQGTEKSVTEIFASKKKMKILVAEDTDSNFKLLTYFLKGTYAEIIRASNGKIAVEKCLSEKNFDLILMDIKMPEMDGLTAVKLIRQANIDIPIVAQSAYADDKEKVIESGCDAFIIKPFDKKGLLKVLQEFI